MIPFLLPYLAITITNTSCSSNHYVTCQHNGAYSTVAYTYDEYIQKTPDASCVLCNSADNCSAPQTTNLNCYINTKTCTMCGSPTNTSVFAAYSDYTFIIKNTCTSNANCPGDSIEFTSPVLFQHNQNMILESQAVINATW
jgi:hypothetical protein